MSDVSFPMSAPEPPVEAIRYYDHTDNDQVVDSNFFSPGIVIETVGYVVHEGKDWIALARDRYPEVPEMNGDMGRVRSIYKKAIISRRRL